jgi:hypothetical protein
VTDVSVELDGTAVKGVRRIQSEVFEVALPEDNLFDAFCADNVPAGIYSPAIDDGFYIELKPLTIGNHTLHILASGTNVSQDITYDLTVVPVTLK